MRRAGSAGRRPRAGRTDCLSHSNSGRRSVTCLVGPPKHEQRLCTLVTNGITGSSETMKCYICLVLLCFANVETNDIITVEAVAGYSAELPCNITADDPDDRLTVLLWYRNGTDTAIYGSRDLRGKAKDVDEGKRRGRYRLVETRDVMFLQMSRVRAEDAGLYYCYADFSVSFAHKTLVHLVVILPPERLWVIQEDGSTVGESISTANHDLGPLHVGDQLQLKCVVFGGKPRPNLTWWTGGRVLKDTSMQLSDRRVRSLLTYGPLSRKDHGRVLTCRAANNKYVDALSIDITLDVYLPPELVSLRGPTGPVRASEVVALQCRVLGARPPPDIVWYLNGKQMPHMEQNITVEASQRLVVSDVELNVTAELDEASIMCCASAHDRHGTYICADNLTFSVTYPPILEIINEELYNDTISVVMGSNVTLNCSISANPAIDNYVWYHENDTVYDSKDASHPIQLQTTLQLDSVEEKAAGEYRCGATNAEGQSESRTVVVDVQYAPICTKDVIEKFGVGKESIRISCEVKANPEPTSYRWVFFNGTNATDVENFTSELNSTDQVLYYNRPTNVDYGAILCWGLNGVPDLNGDADLANKPCKFIITNETVPQSPKECKAVRNEEDDVTVTCEEGHNGGLPQRFTLTARTLKSQSEIMSITNMVPIFKVNVEPKEDYEFILAAVNDKGESEVVVISQDEIIDKEIAGAVEPASIVANITTLSLALCGGVALLVLLACGLVLCTHERVTSAELPRLPSIEPPLCAYNTEESNCETWADSDEGSECHVHRSQSLRRAAPRHSPRHVRRSSSFNSRGECRQSKRSACRVHSLQNINRRREMDILCDHLAGYLPTDTHYSYHKNPTVFYTMPRKQRHSKKLQKENSDEAQNSDAFSLPPPPDEFGSYRAGTRITGKDMPAKPAYTAAGQTGPGYAEIRTDPVREPARPHYNNVIISPMNTVGLPTAGGGQPGLYSYPEDDNQGINTQRTSTLSTFQTSYPRESGF